MSVPPGFVGEFLQRLQDASHLRRLGRGRHDANNHDFPHYDPDSAADRALLASSSAPLDFQLGTGASIFTRVLIPAILSARSEVLLVTCFWAPSATLTALGDALQRLASYREKLVLAGRDVSRLRISVGLSSQPSFLQKLLHTSSRKGHVYPPDEWPNLGLPRPTLLAAGRIDLQVKSLFFLPFSVAHPKFLIVDRERAFLPSCNVSWEAWLEGCVEMRGPSVAGLVHFYSRTWDATLDPHVPLPPVEAVPPPPTPAGLTLIDSTAHHAISFTPVAKSLPTLLLPSSHHRNPRFRPFPWQAGPPPPMTPLNVALLQLFETARASIYVQTPDVTSQPAMTALLDAADRGVDVTVVTSRDVKVLEQLLTAGVTTGWCVRSLVRRYQRQRRRRKPLPSSRTRGPMQDDELVLEPDDLEAQQPRLGRLRVSYFRARHAPQMAAEEPVHTHVKATVVDGRFTVLGSGNMDRASWFTSQELGVLFDGEEFAASVRAALHHVLADRLDVVFDSNTA